MSKLLASIVLASIYFTSLSRQTHSQSLSTEEQKIVDYIDKHVDDANGLLERSVNLDSPTQDLAGVRRVGDLFARELESLGFTTTWLDMPPAMKRAGHLLAEKKGDRGKRILLLGHLDTVLTGEKYRREGNKAFGSGTSDMKSGDVVIIYALKALADTGALKDASIVVMLTGDEEESGVPKETRLEGMYAAAKRSDIALSFDGGASTGALSTQRGQSFWDIEVTAKTGHSSQIFTAEMGSGAIFEASRIMDEFYKTLRGQKYLSFNAGAIAGGTKIDGETSTVSVTGRGSVVPSRSVMWGDLRFISASQEKIARQKMRDIVSRSLPGTSSKITFYDGIPAMSPKKGNDELFKRLSAVSQDLGFGKMTPEDPVGGATDLAEIADLLPCLEDLGGYGGGEHARGEYVELDALPMQAKRAAILIYRLTR